MSVCLKLVGGGGALLTNTEKFSILPRYSNFSFSSHFTETLKQ